MAEQIEKVVFLSTPSARRATCTGGIRDYNSKISIHALREEGDSLTSSSMTSTSVISIHALREEGDLVHLYDGAGQFIFLSTPSARRATQPTTFNEIPEEISIHALREEGDAGHSGTPASDQ